MIAKVRLFSGKHTHWDSIETQHLTVCLWSRKWWQSAQRTKLSDSQQVYVQQQLAGLDWRFSSTPLYTLDKPVFYPVSNQQQSELLRAHDRWNANGSQASCCNEAAFSTESGGWMEMSLGGPTSKMYATSDIEVDWNNNKINISLNDYKSRNKREKEEAGAKNTPITETTNSIPPEQKVFPRVMKEVQTRERSRRSAMQCYMSISSDIRRRNGAGLRDVDSKFAFSAVITDMRRGAFPPAACSNSVKKRKLEELELRRWWCWRRGLVMDGVLLAEQELASSICLEATAAASSKASLYSMSDSNGSLT